LFITVPSPSVIRARPSGPTSFNESGSREDGEHLPSKSETEDAREVENRYPVSHPTTVRWRGTEKGRAFLRVYDHYREMVNLLDKEEEALAQFFPTTVKRTHAAR
jgi:hypothetical protein